MQNGKTKAESIDLRPPPVLSVGISGHRIGLDGPVAGAIGVTFDGFFLQLAGALTAVDSNPSFFSCAAPVLRVIGIASDGSVAFLERIETILSEREGREVRLGDWFDLVGGTSTGAVIAGALALGYRRLTSGSSICSSRHVSFAVRSGVFPVGTRNSMRKSCPRS
jgi:hypothetical protein